MGFGSARKESSREKVQRFFTVYVHSLKPWTSHDAIGQHLELVWKVDKVRTRCRGKQSVPLALALALALAFSVVEF